ncbi:MAG TPA: peptide ABC transporter substrate-binding protein, partial [Pyrinomonadaceae bacterium]|nr:peptide ABC transporter substrate-binding protein [Pyrinomonadaceae bacterium]
ADDGRRWTFHLREDARWTNGDPVTAQDFVRSWRRTLGLGERAPHAALLSNIEGVPPTRPESEAAGGELSQQGSSAAGASAGDESSRAARGQPKNSAAQGLPGSPSFQGQSKNSRGQENSRGQATPTFGVVALDARTLRVTLQRPDMNFPALVAHPVFRPVHELSAESDLEALQQEQAQGRGARAEFGIVTNGAFSLSRLAGDSVELERAASYWDADSVKLERVRFVGGGPEAALASYRAGEVDVVTNAAVEPLAVKLLTPYEDFRRETFAALNYYRFNTSRPPFDDLRVRRALALAIDVERLSKDTLGGATEPAARFLPASQEGSGSDEGQAESSPGDVGAARLGRDVGGARKLLEDAGYPGGVNFPRIRLLVNRNEQQRLVALAVARMWREGLGVETEVVVRPWEEYEAMLRAGDYDVARRSLVMQTTDEETNMLELFGDEVQPEPTPAADEGNAVPTPSATAAQTPGAPAAARPEAGPPPLILTESQALRELPAIPLHFSS